MERAANTEGYGQGKGEAKQNQPGRKDLCPGLTLYRLREDELQVVFGPVLRVLHQLVDAVSPVQAWPPALPGQRHLPPALHDDRALAAGGARVSESPRAGPLVPAPSAPPEEPTTPRPGPHHVPTRPQKRDSGVQGVESRVP